MSDIIELSHSLNKKDFTKLLDKYQDDYHNSTIDTVNDIIDDKIFDNLIDIYSKKFGDYKRIGFLPTKDIVKLPLFMGSMDSKIKDEKSLIKWMKKYTGPYYVEDKIDGVSCLYTKNKLYTRGDGVSGTDITFVLKYLNLPKIKENESVKGEIVMPKNIFEKKYKEKFSNTRNLVSGILNSKHFDINIAKDLIFVAWNYIGEMSKDNCYLQHSEQLDILESYKFKIPIGEIFDTLSFNDLTSFLKKRKEQSEYDIDGLVVKNDIPTVFPLHSSPKHIFGFKVDTYAETEVESVEWNVSKYGILKPIVKFKPLFLSGAELTYASGFNARFINDNKIGPGTIIQLTRSGEVIPFIKSVIKATEASFPTIKYKWNESEVDIEILDKDENDDMKKRKLVEFFKTMKAKFVGESTINKLYNNDINTLKKIFNITVDELTEIEGIKKKGAERIVNAVKNSITNVSLAKIAAAVGIFETGFGERKFQSIVDKYPNILEMAKEYNKDELENYIKKVEGIKTMSIKFVDNIDKFILFLDNHPEIIIEKEENNDNIIFESDDNEEEKEDKKNKLKNKTIVFTGVRNEEFEKIIKKMGGKVTTSVSKNTNILVVKTRYTNSSKELKADQLGIEVLTIEDFEKNYIN